MLRVKSLKNKVATIILMKVLAAFRFRNLHLKFKNSIISQQVHGVTASLIEEIKQTTL